MEYGPVTSMFDGRHLLICFKWFPLDFVKMTECKCVFQTNEKISVFQNSKLRKHVTGCEQQDSLNTPSCLKVGGFISSYEADAGVAATH